MSLLSPTLGGGGGIGRGHLSILAQRGENDEIGVAATDFSGGHRPTARQGRARDAAL